MLPFPDDPKSPGAIVDNKLRASVPCCKCGRVASEIELGAGTWGADYHVKNKEIVFDPLCPGCIGTEARGRLDGITAGLFPSNSPLLKKLVDKSIYYISMVRELTAQNLLDLEFTLEEVNEIKDSFRS